MQDQNAKELIKRALADQVMKNPKISNIMIIHHMPHKT